MVGFWLTILFVIIPGAAGAAIAFLLSKAEEPRPKILALGASIGMAAGLVAALLLFSY